VFLIALKSLPAVPKFTQVFEELICGKSLPALFIPSNQNIG
jgi:hypothetical protein